MPTTQNTRISIFADLQRRRLISECPVGHRSTEEFLDHLGRVLPGWDWVQGSVADYHGTLEIGDLSGVLLVGHFVNKVASVDELATDLDSITAETTAVLEWAAPAPKPPRSMLKRVADRLLGVVAPELVTK